MLAVAVPAAAAAAAVLGVVVAAVVAAVSVSAATAAVDVVLCSTPSALASRGQDCSLKKVCTSKVNHLTPKSGLCIIVRC